MGNSVEIIDPVGGNSVEIKPQANSRYKIRKSEQPFVDFSDAVEKALAEAEVRDVAIIAKAALSAACLTFTLQATFYLLHKHWMSTRKQTKLFHVPDCWRMQEFLTGTSWPCYLIKPQSLALIKIDLTA